jgi:hypothetical protein
MDAVPELEVIAGSMLEAMTRRVRARSGPNDVPMVEPLPCSRTSGGAPSRDVRWTS